MKLTVTIPPAQLRDFIPSAETLAEAMGQGVFTLVKGHLAARNGRTSRRAGFPKSHYWAEAAKAVRGPTVSGSTATIEIDKEGVALHYYGGTVKPKKKALAIPLSPLVADIWPSEAPSNLDLFWPKNSPHGFLKDSNTSELLYLLVPHVRITADPTVLPEEGKIAAAALDAAESLL
jgi:hypothetical protein